MRVLASSGFLFFLMVFAVARPASAAENPIIPEGAKLELVFTREGDDKTGLTEGPTTAPDGSIYFSDITVGDTPGKIMRFDPKTMKTTVFAENSGKSNGLTFDAHGDLIACEGADHGGRRVSRYNIKTGESKTIADRYMGKRFNAPNDLTIDSKGRIYFSDPRYLGNEPRELEHRAVYRIDTDGTVVEVTHDVEKPNGVALSPDGKTLYVGDHNNGTDKIDDTAPPPKKGAMKVLAFPLGPDGLVHGERRVIVDFGEQNGCDGMSVDSDGHIYLTARSLKRPGLLIVDPNGKEVAFLPTGPENQEGAKQPEGLPSNCTFGIGEEAHTLYVTIGFSLYRIRLKTHGK